MIGPLTWELCARADQEVLATFDDRKEGARVVITRGATRTAEVPIALDDPIAALVSNGDTLIRCTIDGWDQPLFCGRVTQAQRSYGESGAGMVVAAADPLAQLEKARIFVTGLGFTPTAEGYYAATAQQAQIMWDLINLTAGNGHGVVQGTLPSSIARTLTFPAGTAVADAIRSIASLQSGAEFEFTPVEAADGSIAQFNVFYPRQGSDKSGSITLRMGIDPAIDNSLEWSYTPTIGGIVNRCVAIGDQAGTASKGGLEYPLHPAYRASHAASIAQFGVWETAETVSGLTDGTLLEAHAKGIVAANAYPIESFSIALDPDVSPDVSPDDLWIGDTVAAAIGLPTGVLDLTGRINAMSLTELENGEVYVDLTCEPEPVGGVTGAALSVVMDSGEGTVPPPPPEEPAVEDPCAPPPPAEPDPCAKKKKKKKGKK